MRPANTTRDEMETARATDPTLIPHRYVPTPETEPAAVRAAQVDAVRVHYRRGVVDPGRLSDLTDLPRWNVVRALAVIRGEAAPVPVSRATRGERERPDYRGPQRPLRPRKRRPANQNTGV